MISNLNGAFSFLCVLIYLTECYHHYSIVRNYVKRNTVGEMGAPNHKLRVWTCRQCSDPNQLTRPEKGIVSERVRGEERLCRCVGIALESCRRPRPWRVSLATVFPARRNPPTTLTASAREQEKQSNRRRSSHIILLIATDRSFGDATRACICYNHGNTLCIGTALIGEMLGEGERKM